tara:strand:- start:291 stop:1742 length:1452 start_codon:yes stop_codon:yes gene_type:complete
MGTLSGNVISTSYKKLVFTNATSGNEGNLFYTLNADGTTDTALTTLTSPITLKGLLTAELGVQLDNGIIKDSNGNESIVCTATGSAVGYLGITNSSTGNPVTITTAGEDNVGLTFTPAGTGKVTCTPDLIVTGDVIITGNDIKSGNESSSVTAISLSSDDVTVVGDLTVTGTSTGKFTLGADADGTDRTIVLGHTTLKTVMGIDDDQDVFAINTGGAFESVNDFEIDASGNCSIKGDLAVVGGNITTALECDSTLLVQGVTTLDNNLVFTGAQDITWPDASGLEMKTTASGGTSYITFTANAIAIGQPMTCSGKVLLSGNTGSDAAAGIHASRTQMWTEKIGGMYKTSIYIDLAGLASTTTDLDIIGLAAGGAAYLGRIQSSIHGSIKAVKMTCLESPTTGADEIDLWNANDSDMVYDNPIETTSTTEHEIIKDSGAWTTGAVKGQTHAITMGSDEYLYLTAGEAGTAGTYATGKFLIELYGT